MRPLPAADTIYFYPAIGLTDNRQISPFTLGSKQCVYIKLAADGSNNELYIELIRSS